MDDFAANHNGGLLVFGPDGMLYIGTGDGGSADDPERNGQDLGSLLGKILRMDPARAETRPTRSRRDNPFVDRAGARPEVYSYGLRNPWRFSFDRENRALAIGDVGQSSLEEIDIIAAGEGAEPTSAGQPSRRKSASTKTRRPPGTCPRSSATVATRAAR